MTEKHTVLGGSCFCGAVRFEVIPPTLWCAHCHCHMCQRAHGAAFVTWVGVPAQQVTITGEQLRWFASSDQAERGFCASCGSSLFFRSQRWPGQVHVTRANFHGDIDRQPEGHAFYGSHVPWVTLGDELPRGGQH